MLSTGMLFETLAIAASAEGKAMHWEYLSEEKAGDEIRHRFEINFHDADVAPDPLYSCIKIRHTDRRYYRTVLLTAAQKQMLEQTLGDKLSVIWKTSRREKLRVAMLNMRAFLTRIRSEICYHDMMNELDWQNPFSPDRIPVHTLPTNFLSAAIMRFAMKSWWRMKMLGKIPGVQLPSAAEMELLPALLCGEHFIIARKQPLPTDPERRIMVMLEEGRHFMRFWLTLTKLGLAMQPSYTPVVFSYYGQYPQSLRPDGQHLRRPCGKLAEQMQVLSGYAPDQIVFMGRIGIPPIKAIPSRSLRKPLQQLIAESP